MRVHELAKELEKDSKEIIAILEQNGVSGKKAQSLVNEEEIQMVKSKLNPKKEEKTLETPAEKKQEKVAEKKVEKKKERIY